MLAWDHSQAPDIKRTALIAPFDVACVNDPAIIQKPPTVVSNSIQASIFRNFTLTQLFSFIVL